MDAQATSGPNAFILNLDLSEARDIGQMVDDFTDWELVADYENRETMMFMLEFGRDCRFASEGHQTMHHPVETGKVPLSRIQIEMLAKFLDAYLNANEQSLGMAQRSYLKMAAKTLTNRVEISDMKSGNAVQSASPGIGWLIWVILGAIGFFTVLTWIFG